MVPLKQRGSEIVLKIANSAADRGGFVDSKCQSRLAKAAVLDSRKEVSDLTEFDHTRSLVICLVKRRSSSIKRSWDVPQTFPSAAAQRGGRFEAALAWPRLM